MSRGDSGDRSDSVAEALERARASHFLNAFVALREEAVEEAKRAEPGPLGGVPVAVKDMFVDGGRAPTCGSLVHAPGLAGTAEVIRRLRAAGAVVLGYTNLHEWGVGTTSAVTATGPVHNPARPGRAAGGSSGGSAAALAGGIVAAAVGSDAAGSIRVPAAYCGIVGLKPTFGRVPLSGFAGEGDPVDHAGPMARSVADLVPLFSVLAGESLELPEVGALRVGVAQGHFRASADPRLVAAVDDAVAALSASAGGVAEVTIAGADAAGSAAGAIVLSFTAALLADELARRPQDFRPETRSVLEIGSMMQGADPPGAGDVRARVDEGWGRAFEVVDVVVTPTVPTLPPAIDDPLVDSPVGPMHADVVNIAFNGPMNLAGVPALSLPCGELEGGTVNLTIAAPRGKDEWALAAGLALERALGA